MKTILIVAILAAPAVFAQTTYTVDNTCKIACDKKKGDNAGGCDIDGCLIFSKRAAKPAPSPQPKPK